MLSAVPLAETRQEYLVAGSGGAFPGAVRLAAVTASHRRRRVYAAYGGVYVAVALVWLWLVDGVRPTGWDLLGCAVALLGMAIIMFAPRNL